MAVPSSLEHILLSMRTVTLIGAIYVVMAATAQNWCPPGAEWTFSYWAVNWQTGETHSGTLLSRYTGDTLLGGHTANRVDETLHFEDVGTGELYEYNWGPTFTRSTSEVLYRWTSWSQQYDTLIWFGAAPGDLWSDPDVGHQYVVLDTTTVEIGGLSLRRLEVQPQLGGEQIGPNNFIYERIGFNDFHTFHPGGFIADGLHLNFRCYRDLDIAFPDPGPVDCGFTVGIPARTSPQVAIVLYPNPGNNSFQLSGLGHRPAHLRILDLQGKMVQQDNNVQDQRPVDASALPAGAYLVDVNTGVGRQVLWWLKE